jgi:SSS family solute:Na+ symporter
VAAGAAQIAVALAARNSQQSALENVLTVAGLVNGPVLGVFLLGTFAPRAGRAAGIVGLAAGIAAAMLAWSSSLFWAWYTAAGALATLVAGAAASLAFPRPEHAP